VGAVEFDFFGHGEGEELFAGGEDAGLEGGGDAMAC